MRTPATLLMGISLIVYLGCYKNAATGRRQLSLVPESEVQNMAGQEYEKFLKQNPPVPASDPDAQMVSRIGNRIAAAINTYYKDKGKSSLLDGYKWEFNLVNNSEANAWCMPGGK
jgi:predicted Zn-dependent protease